jgi:hypothetical protein
MGLFTNTVDRQLEEARREVVPGDTVCPGCKAPFTMTGETLSAFNPALSIEAHRCPACGHMVSRRRPSLDGL